MAIRLSFLLLKSSQGILLKLLEEADDDIQPNNASNNAALDPRLDAEADGHC
jgi:hypothetical protein